MEKISDFVEIVKSHLVTLSKIAFSNFAKSRLVTLSKIAFSNFAKSRLVTLPVSPIKILEILMFNISKIYFFRLPY